MAHCYSQEAEEILDKEFPVLNKGFVRLVDYLGNDSRIVQSARVSYGDGTKTVREDKGLISYLLRNQHTSPFEQVVFTFHIKLPIFVARQMIRHRTARLNEISGRYSIMKDDFYIPQEDDVAFQSSNNKQGRSNETVPREIINKVITLLKEEQKSIYANYQSLLSDEIARELARVNLPLSLYTEWYWQVDLHNLFHFLKLRMDNHAQKEIREYANVMFEIAKKVVPFACEAFEDYIQGGKLFSQSEIKAINDILEGKPVSLEGRKKEIFFEKLGRTLS